MPGCLYSIPHARTLTIPMELNSRASLCSVAQPLPALAHGNLFRPEDGQDWLCGVLGVHGAREKTTAPLPEMDRRDGQLRATQAEKSLERVSKCALLGEPELRHSEPRPRRCTFFSDRVGVRELAFAQKKT